VIIILPPADRRKTCRPVHFYRRIAVADFKMDALYSIVSATIQEILEQAATHAAPMMRRNDRDQQ
jgi:hypothetical protein